MTNTPSDMDLVYRRLPQDLKPVNYAIKLFDFHLEEDDGTYKGHVDIDLSCRIPTDRITLNAYKLRNISAKITSACNAVVTHVIEDEETQRLIIHLDKKLTPSPSLVHLSLAYEATIDGSLTGFYRSQEVNTETDVAPKYVFCTQFQPSDARRAFPCFDEPDFKATFDLSIEAPEDLTVISNMPQKPSMQNNTSNGLKHVAFERTPVMSTYLLAWAIGDLQCVETVIARRHSDVPLPIRVYASPSSLKHAKFALDFAGRVIDYFAEKFGIDYPLPKLDLLAVTEMSDDAMENWGLAIFRSTALLLDEDTSEPGVRTRVAYIIAHELAHQWFGNLVTMTWWDELWLNEGFATWAGWNACDYLYPEWDVWGQFVADDMQEAFALDQLPSSHPVQVPVLDGLEVDSIFDSISYIKGASIIRMLAAHIGQDVFLQGVSDYLRAHMYENAVGDSLWSALEKASGLQIAPLIGPWINTMGFPVVSARRKDGHTLLIEQSPISSSAEDTAWAVPMLIRTSNTVARRLLETHSEDLDIGGTLIKVNVNQEGFYRVNLDSQTLLTASQHLISLSTLDQASILGDAMSMAFTGRGPPTTTVLSILEHFSQSADFVVWTSILSCLQQITRTFSSDKEIHQGLQAYTRKLLKPKAHSLGWTYNPKESYNTQRLRPLILTAAGLANDEQTVIKAQQLFSALRNNHNPQIHPFLLPTLFKISTHSLPNEETIPHLQTLYHTTPSPHEREALATALGHIPTPTTARQVLSQNFSDPTFVPQDLETFALALSQHCESGRVVWTFMQEEWDLVCDRLGGSMAIFDPFVQGCVQNLSERRFVGEVEGFFEKRDLRGFGRGVRVGLDFLVANVGFKEREGEGVRTWLRERGYVESSC